MSTDPADAARAPGDPLVSALAAELARRTGVCWLRAAGRSSPVWHVWSDGALCLVSGGVEQPLPDIEDGARVEVVMRSKDTGGRLLTWVGTASVVRPGDEQWAPTTAALVAARQNLPDPSVAPEVWARESVVRRVVPTGEVADSATLAPGTG